MAELHVLVVDDDEEFREAIGAAIGPGVCVATVATPVEALWALERRPIDILICDLRLATMANGLDVLAAVKELWPQVGRILVTGFGRELDGAVPAHAILSKPCDLGALRELLRLVPVLASGEAHPT